METDIRDIKGLVPLPTEWWVWASMALVAIVLLAVALYFLLRKKPAAPPSGARIRPTPYDLAARALQRLIEEGLIGRGEAEPFYTRLSDIVRRYLEGRFQLHAPERTTEEFLCEASGNGGASVPLAAGGSTTASGTLAPPCLSPGHKTLLGEFLQECDLVKFARLRPGSTDMKRAFDAAERFVHDTRPRMREEAGIRNS